jgi:hypothetical protein
LGERLLCKQEVIGSIPFTSTNFAGGKIGVKSYKLRVEICRIKLFTFNFQLLTSAQGRIVL